MTDPHDEAKRRVGHAAADLVVSGMRVGFGTGSTFVWVLDRLAERIQTEGLELVGVPTSSATARRAEELGIPLTRLEEVSELDLAIDGADEVDPQKALIKGGGGALTREKIVAAAAPELVVIVHRQKLVDRLGVAFPLPVEVLPFGWTQTARHLRGLGFEPNLRCAEGDTPYETDNGNYVLDCRSAGIDAPGDMAPRIASIAGVVEHGLFVGMTGRVLVAEESGEISTL